MRLFPLVMLVFFLLSGLSYGGEKSRVTNEMIYEKLLEMEKRLVEIEKRQAVLEVQFREFKEAVNGRFDQMGKRFEDMNRRLEELRTDTNRRFEELRMDTNARFAQLYTFLWILTGIFVTLTAVVIGFALWDRRTIRRARQEAVEEVERLYGTSRLERLLKALRELAREDLRLAEVLRSFGLL